EDRSERVTGDRAGGDELAGLGERFGLEPLALDLIEEPAGLEGRSDLGGEELQELRLLRRERPRAERGRGERPDRAVSDKKRDGERALHQPGVGRHREAPGAVVVDADRVAALEGEPARALARTDGRGLQ